MAVLAALAASGTVLAAGAELDGDAGALHSSASADRTTSWALEYRQSLSEHFAASFSWLNEGHLPFNHRDGQALQLWWRSTNAGSGLVLEAGAGPYRAYDGTWLAHGYYPDVAHRWAVLGSGAADWYFGNGWFTYLRVNRVQAVNDFSSTAVLVGVGYRFSEAMSLAARDRGGRDSNDADATLWEADFLYGTRIPNSHPTPHDSSDSYGVRRKLGEFAAVSVSALRVGGQPFDWHQGVAVQLWLERSLTPALSVGASLGALATKIPPTPPGYDPGNRGLILNNSSLPFLVTAVTASYRLSSRWEARAVWDRVAGKFSDADIYLAGVGYHF